MTLSCDTVQTQQLSGRLEAARRPLAGAPYRSWRGAARETDRMGLTGTCHAPFQIIVVLSAGQVARPVIVEALQEGITSIQIRGGDRRGNDGPWCGAQHRCGAGSAATVLSGTHIARRNPANLMQALETVPGINQVSRPRGRSGDSRTLPAVEPVLIDGARVTAERRVGPSGTFLDPSVIEGIDVARGPGSVAYGSDALGGVVSVRTRRAEAGSPLSARVTGTIGAGVPERRGSFEVSKGLEHGGVLVRRRQTPRTTTALRERCSTRMGGPGLLAHFTATWPGAS